MNGLVEAVLTAGATKATCAKCGVDELLVPLDREAEPVDSEFLAEYVCSECE